MIMTVELRETAFDPLVGAQALFRRLLEAAAHPGVVIPLGPVPLVVPPARVRPACLLLLALLDREVTFSVVGPEAETLREYLRFNTGARAAAVAAADFVFVTGSGADWSAARRAGLGARRESAPVGERALSLRGLGILDVAPLVDRGDVPLGVDVWLAGADGHLALVPRSTRCRIGGA